MTITRFGRLGMLAVALAFLFGTMPTLAAVAQDADDFDAMVENATDGAGRQFTYTGDDSAFPMSFMFMMIEFEEESQAEEARDLFINTMSEGFFDDGDDVDEDAEDTFKFEYELQEEYDVVDGGVAYRFQVEEGGYEAIADYIVVLDGTNLHIWLGTSFSMEPGAPVADPLETLTPLVEDWFGDGSLAGEDALDRLPNVEDLPEGYELEDEFEGIDELLDEGDDVDDLDDDLEDDLDDEDEDEDAAA